MSYKDAWNEKYCQLSLELFDKEYWDCTPAQLQVLDTRINNWAADFVANQIDEAKERAKYQGLA